jgi:GDP-L-fucose synthase
LIRKSVEAKERGEARVLAWGTGKPTREFLYVEDAAEAIVLAAECYEKADPVNLGTGWEVRIWDLVHLIARLVGYQGEIAWDSARPDGQPRRCLDTTRARMEFGFQARTSLEEGLRRTIEWYMRHKAAVGVAR